MPHIIPIGVNFEGTGVAPNPLPCGFLDDFSEPEATGNSAPCENLFEVIPLLESRGPDCKNMLEALRNTRVRIGQLR